MTKADVVVGIQWGDEGKGRVVDARASHYDIVARFGGGDNAGHTIVVGDRKLALRIVPSGVLQAGPDLFIGGGTVVSLEGFVKEVEMLAGIGVDVSRIKISDRAHVVFPFHAMLDALNEAARGGSALGTTGRGIGPAYTDKTARNGITFADLRDDTFAEKVRANGGRVGDAIKAAAARQPVGDRPPQPKPGTAPSHRIEVHAPVTDPVEDVRKILPRVLPHIVDGVEYLHGALESGKRLLIEGAQGSLLDVGYGTYPFVTSSHTIAGGACIGLGIGPTQIGSVTGIAKAYCTRVGAGPFPSELHDDVGVRLRERGKEFGTVTGRPRRCGWFDAVAARYAVRINGLTNVVITKLDVLSGLGRIGVVTGYRLDGKPATFGDAANPRLELEIRWFEGWDGEITGCRKIADLPPAAIAYVGYLETVLGVPIDAVSVGPERDQLAVP
jgi:adenylosuccinate synthase